MNAVVMCGGLGSRMLPLSEKTPKPMLRVMNRPVLDYLLKKLARDGFTDIYLTLGYRAEEIVSYLENRDYGVNVVCRREEKPLGTAGGVKNALKDVPGDFLVISGDNLIDFPLDALRERHEAEGRQVTIVGAEVADPRDYGVIVAEKGVVTGFTEKPDWEQVRSFFVNTGIYFCSGDVLDLIPEGEPFDFAKDLFPLLLRRPGAVGAVKADGRWFDIGGVAEYRETNAELLKDPANAEPEAGVYYGSDSVDAEGNRIIAPCLLGRGVSLGGGATVGPFCSVGAGTEIGRDCVITDSIIGENCVVGSATDVHAAVLADRVQIRENALLENGAVVGYGAQIGRFTRVFPEVKISAGVRVPPESLVSEDLRDRSGGCAALDLDGMSGRVWSGVTLSDALRAGQALAGALGGKIGFGCDGDPASELYLGVCQCGAASCGAEAYDFGRVFRGQIGFYAHHCALSAFVFVSCKEGEVTFRFSGEGGLPFGRALRRRIEDGYRYGAFAYAEPGKVGRRFRMELFSSVYKARLKKSFAAFKQSVELTVESADPFVAETAREVLQYGEREEKPFRLLFITDGGAGESYVAEDDKVFYGSAALLFLCEYEFARGNDVAVPEDAPELIGKKAAVFGRKVYRAGPEGETPPDKALAFNCLWAFDGLFLAFRICEIMARSKMKLTELLKDVESVSVRKNICVFDCEPETLHRTMEAVFGARAPGSAYYRVLNSGAGAKVRQMGNSSRVRILSESAEMEAAKELSAEIAEKIHAAVIDNSDKIE